MASATDLTGSGFNVGDNVLVPCVVAAVGGSPQVGVDNLTLTPKYKTPNGTTPSDITSTYATQVIVDR